MTSLLRSRATAIVLVTIAIAALGIEVAAARIPSTNGTITACVKSSNGNVRVIDAEQGAQCKDSERRLDFNQRGPRGVVGPAGPAAQSDLVVVQTWQSGPAPAEWSVTCPSTHPFAMELYSIGTYDDQDGEASTYFVRGADGQQSYPLVFSRDGFQWRQTSIARIADAQENAVVFGVEGSRPHGSVGVKLTCSTAT